MAAFKGFFLERRKATTEPVSVYLLRIRLVLYSQPASCFIFSVYTSWCSAAFECVLERRDATKILERRNAATEPISVSLSGIWQVVL